MLSLKPREGTDLPMPFRNRRMERERERKAQMARKIDREFARTPIFSFSHARPPSRWRMEQVSSHKPPVLLFALMATATMALVIGSFVWGSRLGLPRIAPPVLWAENWGEDRTAEDALRDREERLARLRAEFEARDAAMRAAGLLPPEHAPAGRAATAQ